MLVGGPGINAAQGPAFCLDIPGTPIVPHRLHEVVEPDEAAWNEKVGQQSLCVWLTGGLGTYTEDRNHLSSDVLTRLSIPVVAPGITMDP